MKVSELARILDISNYRVWRWIAYGSIEAYKKGARYEIPLREVEFILRVFRKDRVYTVSDLADMWQCHPTTVIRRLTRRRIRMRMFIGRFWILKEELDSKYPQWRSIPNISQNSIGIPERR